ncbi:hypothetical protein JNN96_04360 [Mycobacterium sp. DSM 3803]|nr:hypothetical protein [Mycobacterium sp. DSM 3803]OKH71643.1 hypothetical protein EB73_10265 [Mycobacterium sp. SWH-M3]
MPKWWPWGRSARQTAPVEPATQSAPVGGGQPAWQRLAPVQRTVGDIEPTAQFEGFTESLTTSQNPGFTRPVSLLTADHTGIPVLDAVPAHPDVPAAPAERTRSWAPRLPSVQRAHVGVSAPVQRLTEQDSPVPQVFPVEDPGIESPSDMVQASDVDERRPLDVAPVETVVLSDAHTPTDRPSTAGTDTAPLSPVTLSGPAGAPTVQRSGAGTAPGASLPVVQAVSSRPTPPEPRKVPELRRLAPVQRTTTTSPLPILRTVDTAAPNAPAPSTPTTDTDTATAAPAVTSEPGAPESDAPSPAEPELRDVAADSLPGEPSAPETIATPAPPSSPTPAPTNSPPSPHVDDAPVVPIQRAVSPSAPLPVDADVHRVTKAESIPTVRVEPLAPPTTSPSFSASATRPNTTTTTNSVPSMQRTEASPSAPAHSRAAVPVQRLDTSTPIHVPAPIAAGTEKHGPAAQPTRSVTFAAQRDAEPGVTGPAATIEHTCALAEPSAVHAEGQHVQRTPAEPVIGQRLTLPVVDSPAAPSPATPVHPVVPVHPVAQRAVHNRRLVVLPPVRTDTGAHPLGVEHTAAVGSSPRPVGLQRMFSAAGSPSTLPPAAAQVRHTETGSPYVHAPELAGPAGGFAFDEPSHHYDADTNTITFDTAHIQRDTDDTAPAPAAEAAPPPPPESAAAVAAAPAAAAAAGAAAPGGTNVDELLNKLYDPLVARLRAELWLDRERAGMLMDLGR